MEQLYSTMIYSAVADLQIQYLHVWIDFCFAELTTLPCVGPGVGTIPFVVTILTPNGKII